MNPCSICGTSGIAPIVENGEHVGWRCEVCPIIGIGCLHAETAPRAHLMDKEAELVHRDRGYLLSLIGDLCQHPECSVARVCGPKCPYQVLAGLIVLQRAGILSTSLRGEGFFFHGTEAWTASRVHPKNNG